MLLPSRVEQFNITARVALLIRGFGRAVVRAIGGSGTDVILASPSGECALPIGHTIHPDGGSLAD